MADAGDQFKSTCTTGMDLFINLGLITSISSQWPEEVQDNWTQRLEHIEEYLVDQTREAQEFASALD